MTWQVHQEGMIFDGDRVVGSMVPDGKGWRVEILWSGPGGDIVHWSDDHRAALAFIIGAEAVFNRLAATTVTLIP